jgi:hypothetical protein
MARMTNTEILTKYREKLEHSRRWRKEERYDDLWSRLIDLYRGKHHRTDIKEDQLLINIAFATINVISPAVSINHPKIAVNAKRPEDADKAIVTEAIINYWWQHYGCQEQFRRAVKDFLICGHGWVKTGYRYVEEEKARDETPNFDSYDELATPGPEAVIESELIIKEDRAFLERVSLFDMFVDPDATSMDDIRWIAQRTRRPMDEVKKDKRYNATARNECAPSHYSKWGQDQFRPRMSTSKDDSYVEIWEWYDIDRNTMSVFCDGSDKFLVSPTKMPFLFGHPYTMIRNYDVPDYFYPMGELEAIEPLQHELNQTRTQMMNHRKRFSRKWLYKETAFDVDGRSALESDEDNVMVPVISEENINNIVTPMPAVINPPEFYNQSSLISDDIRSVSGLNEYQGGGMPEIRRTATEAAIIQDAANARVSDKLAIVEKAIGECGRRLIMLAQQYMTGEQAVRIVGSEAEPVWLQFDRDYIQGEFDFLVEGGSTQPVNESFRRQMAMQVVDAMAPFAGAGILDMPKLATYVLQYGFGIRGAGSFVTQQPMMPVPPQGVGPEGQPPETPGGMPMPQDAMGQDPMAEPQEMPPTGGAAMPSNIPPEILAQLLAQGAPLPNTQGGM